jgi:peptidyl-prolyl cis-trans isomerase B (cyclophilin B)
LVCALLRHGRRSSRREGDPVSPSKREREFARRRYQEWERRREAARARKRRQRVIAGVIVGALVVALGVGGALAMSRETPAPTASPSSTPTATKTYTLASPSVAEARAWTGTITLNSGAIGISLDGVKAPQAVANFVSLAKQGYFTSTPCHRLVTGGIKVLQCGDPTGTGNGGPGYNWGPIENAPADGVYPAGTIAMARVGGNGASMGSQFFIVYKDSTIPADAAGGYTVFGHITSGLDVVQAIADAGVQGGATDGPPLNAVSIEGVEVQ